jgi:hypothetical protein
VTFKPTPEKVAEHLHWKEEELTEATVIEQFLAGQMDQAERRRWNAEHDLAEFKDTIARYVACRLLGATA